MAKNKAKMNKFVTGVATAAMVATAVVPVASAAGFTDLDKVGADVKVDIDKAVDLGFFIDAPKFNPSTHITRGQAALTLARYIAGESSVEAYVEANNLEDDVKLFEDIPASYKTGAKFEQELYYAALVVKNAGAFTQDYLNPAGNVTRSQMAKIVTKTFDLGLKDGFESKITDIGHLDAETKGFIETIASQEITIVDAFMPAGHVTRSQMASFLVRANDVVVAGEVEEVAPDVESIKAINNTTVEVTFKEGIVDIKALDFAIEGLDVSNAAVKQTNNKTVVLTTSAQEGDKVYTVTVNDEKKGTFAGISAVVPTKIDITSNSTQAVVGQEVTVSAQVEVAEGQSKAGIPVTFNIITNRGGINSGAAHEVTTDANGVATYTYTQYYGGQDTVVAYPTGSPATRSTEGKVYWGAAEQLTITEVTEGNSLANGSKKVYKVVAKNEDGGALKNAKVNIAFLENVNVAQDKGVTGVKVTDALGAAYPYQYTTGGESNFAETQVQLDKDGEATFTLTGSGDAVTPVVFFDGTWMATSSAPDTSNGKWDATELQVQAPKVTFDAVQNIEVAVESIGTKDAAAISGGGDGGRDYKAVIRNKDGKIAPKGTKAHVTVTTADLKGTTVQVVDNNDVKTTLDGKNSVELTVGNNGEVEFTLIGNAKEYATPTVYIDNGSTTGALDATDVQGKGEIVYFGDAVLKTATIEVTDKAGKKITAIGADKTAYFHFQITDQNGKDNSSKDHKATFEVKNTGFINAIQAKDENSANWTTILADRSASVPFTSVNGKAVLEVTADGATDVNVDVSSSQVSLDGKAATVAFTSTSAVNPPYTGIVAAINTNKEVLNFTGKDAVSYANATYKNENGVELSEEEFVKVIQANLGDAKVTYTKVGENVTFEIVDTKNDVPGLSPDEVDANAVTALINGLPAVDELALTDADEVEAARAAYDALNEDAKALISAEDVAALEAAESKIAELENAGDLEGVVITSAEAIAVNNFNLALGIFEEYVVEGTVADDSVTSVELVFTYADDTQAETTKVETVTVTDGKFSYTLDTSQDSLNTIASVQVKIDDKSTANHTFFKVVK